MVPSAERWCGSRSSACRDGRHRSSPCPSPGAIIDCSGDAPMDGGEDGRPQPHGRLTRHTDGLATHHSDGLLARPCRSLLFRWSSCSCNSPDFSGSIERDSTAFRKTRRRSVDRGFRSRPGPGVGSAPDEDPTQGRELGEVPYDDPTQRRARSSLTGQRDPRRGRCLPPAPRAPVPSATPSQPRTATVPTFASRRQAVVVAGRAHRRVLRVHQHAHGR